MAKKKGMTAARWDSCRNSEPMLRSLPGRADERKLRLFGCACCRHVWEKLTDEHSRRAVEVAERFADGEVDAERLAAAAQNAFEARVGGAGPAWAPWYVALTDYSKHPGYASNVIGNVLYGLRSRARAKEAAAQCDLLRCIFGNPFRPADLAPDLHAWLGGLLVSAALRMYEARDFADLPVLADMLEDAGCTDARVLAHCRGPGPHARGCFVLDLLLNNK